MGKKNQDRSITRLRIETIKKKELSTGRGKLSCYGKKGEIGGMQGAGGIAGKGRGLQRPEGSGKYSWGKNFFHKKKQWLERKGKKCSVAGKD